MEAIKIRKSGFSLRISFADFVDRYAILVGIGKPKTKDTCNEIVRIYRKTLLHNVVASILKLSNGIFNREFFLSIERSILNLDFIYFLQIQLAKQKGSLKEHEIMMATSKVMAKDNVRELLDHMR